MAAEVTKIPAVWASPTTLQYIKPQVRKNPYYIQRFRMTKEDWQKTLLQPWLRTTDPLMPAYPYGRNMTFPEANYGLYGGCSLMSGNKISKGRNKGKTVRKWFPNIRLEDVRSEALDRTLSIPIRARVMRTIKKCGGLDEYLLGNTSARIKELGLLGWKLRYLIMRSPEGQKKLAAERKALGLTGPDPLSETFSEVWNKKKQRQKLIREQEAAWQAIRDKVDRWDNHVARHWEASDNARYAGKARPRTLDLQSPAKATLPTRIAEERLLPKQTRRSSKFLSKKLTL
jgi:large subunit ribosomal protein L28